MKNFFSAATNLIFNLSRVTPSVKYYVFPGLFFLLSTVVTVNSRATNYTSILSSVANQAPAANHCKGTSAVQVYGFSLQITSLGSGPGVLPVINGITFSSLNVASDITRYQLWVSTVNNFSGATQLGSDITTSLGSGPHSFTFSNDTLSNVTTYYFWITADINASATAGNTINVVAIANSAANISYVGVTPTCTGSATAGGTQTIVGSPAISASASPNPVCEGDILSFSSTPSGGSGTYSGFSWAGPVGFTSTLQNPSIGTVSTAMAGIYSVTVTDNNGCSSAVATTVVSVNPLPAPIAVSGSGTYCGSGTIGASGGSGGTIYYQGIVSGGTDISTPAVSMAESASGTYYFRVRSSAGCWGTEGSVTVTINTPATVSAGSDQTICAGGATIVSGSIGGSATSSTWSAQTGSFADPSSLTTSYMPAITSGTDTLTLTTNDPDGAGPCSSVVSTLVITVNPAVLVNAGTNQTVCSSTTGVSISGTVSGGATTGTWSTTGTGTFADATLLSTTYYPSAADISAGTVDLILTSANPAGPCDSVNNYITITIIPAVTVSAGGDQTICSSNPNVSLTGSVSGPVTTGTWSTLGTGSFSDATSLTTTYTMSSADLAAGSVTIVLTSDDPGAPCASVANSMVISVNPEVITTAGPDQTICSNATVSLSGTVTGGASTGSWTTFGTGSFADASSLSTTYAPSSDDSAAGVVFLMLTSADPGSPCSATASLMLVTINPSVYASAGADQTICSSDASVTVTGTVSGGVSTGSWSTSGSGTFSDTGALTTTYFPSAADISAGSVYLSLNSSDPGAPCAVAGSFMSLTINPAAVVSAGADQTVCASSPAVTLAGTISGGTSAGTWTTSGTGTFSDASSPTATYTLSSGDITTGFVFLTLTSAVPAGPCGAASNSMTITVNPAVTVDAGPDQTVCGTTAITFTGTVSGGASTGHWTSGGSGTFSDDSSLTTTYFPSAADFAAGSVTLRLTSADPAGPCDAVFDSMILTLNPYPTVVASSNSPICAGGNLNLNAVATGYGPISYSWTGPAAFSSATASPSITGVSLANAGTYTVTVGAPGSGCNSTATTTVVVNTLTATPTNSSPACVGGTINLNGGVSGSAGLTGYAYNWNGPLGYSSSSANPTLTTSATTAMAGTYNFTVTATGSGCIATGSTSVVVNTIAVAPTNSSPACVGGTVNLFSGETGTAPGVSYLWSGPLGYTSTVSNPVRVGVVASSAGVYSVTATASGSGCLATNTTTVTINPTPTTAPTNSSPACVGGTVNLSAAATAVGTITYSWFGPAGFTSAIANPTLTSVSLANAGTYSVTVSTPGSGCTATNTTTVTINPTPTASPTNTSPLCIGGLFNLSAGVTAVGSPSFYWSGPSGFTSTLAGPGVSGVTFANAGTYTVTATTPGSGCTVTATTVVTINPLPTTSPTNTSPVCVGGSVSFNAVATAVGPITYSWTGPSGFISSIATPSISGVATTNAGIYISVVTTPGSGCTATNTTVVTVDPMPTATPTNTSPVCVGSSVNLHANPSLGVIGYSWSGPAGFTSTLANPVVTPSATGTYSLTVTSGPGSGCSPSSILQTIATVNPLPATVTGTTNVCVGSATTLSCATTGGIWASANPSLAAVGSASGVVNGLAAGITTIMYRLPTGCTNMTPVTVNSLPAAIVGASSVCSGASTVLTNATSGGTWTSSNPAVASVGSASGVVTGGAAGTATIFYTLGTGCSVSTLITVNPVPTTITGTTNLCVGASSTLGSTPGFGSGTWSSSNTSLASIGSSSGFITGVAAGNPIITYMLPTGCQTTTTATINALPAAITGSGTVCTGGTTTLSDATSGGTWSSLSSGVATIGSTSGVVNGILSGTTTIVYSSAAGCNTSTIVTVNTVAASITGTASGCVGFSSTLSSAPSGGTWTSSNTSMATVGSSSGIVNTFSAGNPVITYTASGGCTATKILTINATPATISGATTVCQGATTSLSSTTPGGSWSSGSGSIASVGATTGTVTGLLAGNATIFYNLPGGCSTSAIVTVNATPTAITGTVTGCVGFTSTLSSTPTGGTWTSSNSLEATIGSSTGAVITISAGSPVITYSAPNGCYTTAVLTTNPYPSAIIGGHVVCVGSSVSLTDTTFGGTWSSSVSSVATVGSTTGVVNGGTFGTTTISYTLATGCAASTSMTVNTLPPAISGTTHVCAGLSTTLSATPSGGTWSTSNPLVATVGSSSGMVSGMAAGTAILTYTGPNGCFTTAAFTVNPNPAAIAGITSVCPGLTTTLYNTSLGGTWSSSNPAQGSVHPTTGVVTGITPGTPAITYTLPTGCISSVTITVNSLPSSITGSLNVCAGLTTTLNSTPSGGTWTSNNPASATIGSVSGVVAAVATGSPTMTYSLPTGCYAIATISVNPVPAAISGPDNVCAGSSIVLTDAATGGTWASSNSTVAPVGSGSGVVSGSSIGTATITYALPTGCLTSTGVTVNATPGALTGTNHVCVGLTTTLNSTPAGGTWSSSNPSMGSVAAGTGVVTGLSAGTPTISYTLSTGCNAYMQITVNPLPATITGTRTVCTGDSVTLASTPLGGSWSSSAPASGSITSGAGVLTGIASGNPTITYTLPTGCLVTTVATVNPSPAAITGTNTVCVGLTTTLNSTPAGGSWSSSNLAEATVGSANGIVTGSAAGTPVISYVLGTGCYSKMPVTVNALPANITGSSLVCLGSTTTLNDLTAGGTWSSSGSAATVGSSTGIVTGAAIGSAAVTYTLPTTCMTTFGVSVTTTPSPITGVTSVCPGSTTNLFDATTGGSWSTSNSAIATVGSTGVVTGVAAGVANISYAMGAGCYVTTSVIVNAAPNLSSFIVSSSTSPCLGGSSSVNVMSASIGSGTYTGTYNLAGANSATANTASLVMGSVSGSLNIPAGSLTNPGSTTFILTSVTNGSGCSSNLSAGNSAGFTVNALPTVYTVTGGGNYCAGGAGVHVFLSGSTVGVNYQLMLGGSPAGAPVAGTSSSIDFGPQTAAGTYTVVATNATAGCTANMAGSASIVINPAPAAYAITGGGSYCSGGPGVTVGLANSQSGVNYQLFNGATAIGSAVSGSSSPITFGLQTLAGTYSVVATNAITGCTSNMTGSASVVVNPLPSSFTGPLTACVLSTTALGSSPAGGTWSSSAPATGSVNSLTGVVTGMAPGTTVVSYTLSTGCGTSATITVNPLPSAITGTTNVCAGAATTLSDATPSGSWSSSNPALATVSSSGVVTGVSSGTPVISYVLSTGCLATTPVTVNAAPAAIAGPSAVCVSGTIALTDAVAGGVWSATGSASVGSASGIVSGSSVGTATITYTLGTCSSFAPISVNASPAAITGSFNVCAGQTTILNNTTPGGTWSSSNTAVASVGSTGLVSGITPGTAIISYSTGAGCTVSATVTVNTTPASISGTSNICFGATATFTDATAGGTWSSSASGIAGVTSIGLVSGVSAGTATISYSIGGCNATYPVTVNSAAASITGTLNACVGGSSTLSTTSSGGTWSSGNPAIATVGATTGTVIGVNSGVSVITYTLGTGCNATANFTVNRLPAAITGVTTVCTSQTTALFDATTGGMWSCTPGTVAGIGSGSGIVNGLVPGTATVSYTLPTGCAVSATITVNQSPASISGGSSVCTNATLALSNSIGGGTWTSSNTSLATVGSLSGSVFGVANGAPVISYTLSSGCFATQVISVNPGPAAISGTLVICSNASTLLADATTGGSWLSGSTGIANVGVSTGSVTGVAGGTAAISYVMPTGCFSTTNVTVNPIPSVITGSNAVCVGSNVNLSDTLTGGIWTSSNTSVATVGTSSGSVAGITAGTTVITYTLPTGCSRILPMTVNPLPAAITGTSSVCVGGTTSLSDATTGGTWSASSSIASINASSGVVNGISAGSLAFTYTLPTSCLATIGGTVNTLPSPFTVTGGGAPCAGGTGVHIGLSGSVSGVSYQLYNGTSAYGSPLAGTGIALDFGVISTAGTYTVIATNTTTGCTANMSGSATVAGAGIPTAFSLTGGGSYCAGSIGVTIALSGSQSGTSYQLYIGSTAVGSPVIGTGSAIGFGPQTTSGTYTAVATNTSGCTANMVGTAIVSTNPLPTAYSVTGGGVYCAGATGLHIGLSNSTTGTNYQLSGSTGSIVTLAGTGSSLDFGLFTAAGTYTVSATTSSTGCTAAMTGSATISTSPAPNSYTVSGGGNYCAGGSGLTVQLSNSDPGISYQLLVGATSAGSPRTGGSGPINFGPQTTAGIYTVLATNISTGCSATMSGSATITVSALPAVYAVTGGGSYCSGSAGVSVGMGNSQAGITYKLYVGTSLVASSGGTGAAFSFGTFTTAGTYTAVAVSSSSCSSNMSGSVAITTNPLPTVYSVTGGGSYCAGGSGVLVGLSSSQPGVNYRLLNAGVPTGTSVSGTGAAISFGLQAAGTSYTVQGTDAVTSCVSNMSGSTAVTANPLPTAYSVTGGGSYCVGGSGQAVGLANSQPSVSYQLRLGSTSVGSPVSGSSTSINFGLQTAVGTYTVTATNTSTGCSNNMTGSASVSTVSLPAVYSVTGGGSFCSGSTGLAVGLSGSQSGVSYQLYNGPSPVGSSVSGTGSAVSFGTLSSAGTYTVVATSGSSCTNNMSGSAVIAVNPLPASYSVTGGGAYCLGGSGTHVGLSNSDPGINYQLKLGTSSIGSPVIGSGLSLDFGPQTTSGTYTVSAVSTSTGCTSSMTGGVSVTAVGLPNAYNVTGGGSYCASGAGDSVNLSNSQSGVTYQLYVGSTAVGSPVSGTGSPVSFGTQTTAGTYTAVATATGTGCTNAMTGSATVAVNSLPTAYTVTGGGSFCSGGTGVSVGLTGSDLGVNYRLYNGTTSVGSLVAGTGSAISFGLQTTAGTYTVVAANATTACTNNMLGTATIAVNSAPASYSVTGGGNYCTGGTAPHVGLIGSSSGTSYQLYRTGVAVGSPLTGTGIALDFGPQTFAGTYTVTATNSSTGCNAAMAGSASVAVNTSPSVYTVTGGGSYCSGGTGVNIGLSGSSTGVSYRLYNGTITTGVPLSGTGSALSFGPQTAGTYTVVASNSTSGCTTNMAGNPTVTSVALPAAYTVTGGGSYCSGGTGVHVGLSGSVVGVNYQLMNSSTTVGSAVAGTGAALDFGLKTAAGSYIVIATNVSTSCSATMTGSATVTVNSLPTVYAVSGGGAYCTGGSGVSVNLAGSQSGVNYQLYRSSTSTGGTVSGTGSSISFGSQTTAGTYTVVAASGAGCSATMSGSATVSVNSLPAAYTVSGGGTYCTGSGYHIQLNGSASGVSYQLYNGSTSVGSPMSGTGASLDFGAYTTSGTYTVHATNSSTSCSNNMTGSAVITSGTLPTAYSVTGGGSLCSGGTGHAVGLSGSSTGINYQLYRSATAIGAAVAGTGSALNFGTQTVAGGYTVIATNASTGCVNNMSGSATITVFALPTAYSVTGGGTYCAGGSGVHVGLGSSATGVNYQLYRGTTAVGSAVAGTGSALDFGPQTTAGTYTATAINTTTSCTNNMTGNATVSTTSLPAAGLISGPTSVHTGATITLTDATTGGTWSSANAYLSVGSATGIVTGISAGSGTISYTVSNSCGSASATYSVTEVGPAPPPHAGSILGSTSICVGSTTALSNSVSGGQWTSGDESIAVVEPQTGVVTGISAGVAAITYTLSNSAGTSQVFIPIVVASAPDNVTIVGVPSTPIVADQKIALTAQVANNAPVVSYQWLINKKAIAGATSAKFVYSGFTDNDEVSCELTCECGGVFRTASVIISVAASSTTSINKAPFGDLRVIPNPNNGTFDLRGDIGNLSEEQVRVEVINMIGQVLYSKDLAVKNGGIDERIQLSGTLPNGMYLLNVSSDEGTRTIHVMIEQ